MSTLDRTLNLIRQVGKEIELRPEELSRLTETSTFDKDLGLDSLAKVELLDRVEHTFNIKFKAEVFNLVNTPNDLVREITRASKKSSDKDKSQQIESETEDTQELPSPKQAETLLDVLAWHSDRSPERKHIRFYQEKGNERVITYQDLDQSGRKFAHSLSLKGVKPGDRVAIMLPTLPEYFFCFTGILMLGAIPVPLYPPVRKEQLKEHIERHLKILGNAGAVALIATKEIKLLGEYLEAKVASIKFVATPSELESGQASFELAALNWIKRDTLAFIQYTSGSTGDPKGVALTHEELLANIRVMGERLQANSKDVMVSWLPLYHDMGLIGAWLGCLYFGAKLVLMSPFDFIVRPANWLWAIHRHRATLTAAPNFAFDFCLKRIKEDQIEGLDLSSLRAVLNGAEAVSPVTLKSFTEYFSKYGFNEKCLMPVYGLAENSVGLTFTPLDRGPLVKTIDRDLMMKEGKIQEAGEGGKVVSSGVVLPKHEVRIVGREGEVLAENRVGEIEFQGPSSTRGYFNAESKTKDLFHDDWLRTGDLGFLSDGELFITGRIKDIIIKAGRNISPQELEERVGNLKGVRKGNVVAFAVIDPKRGSEKLVIAAEIKKKESEFKRELKKKINELTVDLLDTGADEILLMPAHSILKTSSGKIRRSACKEAYLAGDLGRDEDNRPILIQMKIVSRVALLKAQMALTKTYTFGRNFFYSSFFFFMMAIFFLPVTLWVVAAPEKKKWQGMRKFISTFLFCTGIKLSLKGRKNLPSIDEPCVFVANHHSYIDSAILSLVLERPLIFIAKKELLNNIVFRKVLPLLNTIFVERDLSAKALEELKSAQESQKMKKISLVFFPEGTFAREAQLLRFHMGAFVTALNNELPIVPVALKGTGCILGEERFYPAPGNTLEVTIGEIIPVSRQEHESNWQDALVLRDKARAQMNQGLGLH